MLETSTSFSDILPIQPFKNQELTEIKEHISMVQSTEDTQEDIDEYLRTILSEQKEMEYVIHAQRIHRFF